VTSTFHAHYIEIVHAAVSTRSTQMNASLPYFTPEYLDLENNKIFGSVPTNIGDLWPNLGKFRSNLVPFHTHGLLLFCITHFLIPSF
jgi:hypothetical protein